MTPRVVKRAVAALLQLVGLSTIADREKLVAPEILIPIRPNTEMVPLHLPRQRPIVATSWPLFRLHRRHMLLYPVHLPLLLLALVFVPIWADVPLLRLVHALLAVVVGPSTAIRGMADTLALTRPASPAAGRPFNSMPLIPVARLDLLLRVGTYGSVVRDVVVSMVMMVCDMPPSSRTWVTFPSEKHRHHLSYRVLGDIVDDSVSREGEDDE